MTAEEKKNKKLEKKQKKAMKIAKHRPLKNFLWFLFGFLFNLILIASVTFVAVKVLPLKTYFGEDENKISAKVQDQSILDIALALDSYKVGDFPIIVSTLEDELNKIDIIDGIVEFDFKVLNDSNLKEVGSNIKDVVKVVATLDTISSKFDISLGDFANMAIFKEWEEVSGTVDPATANDKLYYYCTNAGSQVQDRVYKKAIENGAFVSGVSSSTQLYYPALNKIVATDAISILSVRIKDAKAKDLLGSFMTFDESSMLGEVIGDKKVSELGSLDTSSFLLKDFDMPDDVLQMLCDASSSSPKPTKDTITVADISNFDMDNIKLSSVLDATSNDKLFTIIKDATGFTGNKEDITISAMSSFDANNIHLTTVLESSTNNILSALLEDSTVTLGNLGDKVDGLSLEKVYPATCFEVNASGKYYKLDNGGYVLSTQYNQTTDGDRADTNLYNVSSEANIWILMYYTASSDVDSEGYAYRYAKVSTLTVGGMQTAVNGVGQKFQGATVRQLVDAGILTDPNYSLPALYSKTINELINPTI